MSCANVTSLSSPQGPKAKQKPWHLETLVVTWLVHGWCHVKCFRFDASSVYTIQPCTRSKCHLIQSHIGRVYVCLALTCHLHFWQNEWDLLRATAVTLGWNGYRNKSEHRKLTLVKKILPPLLPGLEPGTFRSRVRRSNHWAIPAPHRCSQISSLNSWCATRVSKTHDVVHRYALLVSNSVSK